MSPPPAALLVVVVFATLAGFSAALTSQPTNPQAVFWWNYTHADCGYDDVSPQPACGKAHKGDVDALKACCIATDGCGGFNTNGIIKKTDCLYHKQVEPACDLYVKETTPQPPPPPPSSNWPPIWPLPKSWANGTTQVFLLPSKFTFKDNSATKTATLKAAFERYRDVVFYHACTDAPPTSATLSSLEVSVDSSDESHPQLGTDESYTLNISSAAQGGDVSAHLHARTVYGALRGIETFSQLVRFDFDHEMYTVPGLPWTISDAPRFPHRGLMLDTARHFETLTSIRRMVDALPYAKMNVLHWHMADSQSFPMQSMSAPKLWEGAYSKYERYTQRDIAAVVEYARLRGIRVMVEFDMPGHAGSWCNGYPDICPSTTCTQPLNVASNATFDLISALLLEMTGGRTSAPAHPSGLFPENMLHLGGDEVNTDCWTRTPAVKKWLDAKGLTADEGYAYFVKRAAAIALAQGRRPVQWVEVFDHFGSALDNRTIVHVWKAKSTLNAVVGAGYNALINNSPGKGSWYLDHLPLPTSLDVPSPSDRPWCHVAGTSTISSSIGRRCTPTSRARLSPTQSSAPSSSVGRGRCGGRRSTCPTLSRRCGRALGQSLSASGAPATQS